MYQMVKLDEYIHNKNFATRSLLATLSEFSRCPYMDKIQPKLDAILCGLCIYYGSASVLKWPQKQFQRS